MWYERKKVVCGLAAWHSAVQRGRRCGPDRPDADAHSHADHRDADAPADPALHLDFAHAGPGGNVAVALPADLQANAHDAITSLEHGFLPSLGGSKGMASLYVSEREPELRIDFLTVPRRGGRTEVHAPDLGVALRPLKFLDYLIERPGQAVLLDRADAVLVNLPDPARYGLHKLIVAHERGARHPGRQERDEMNMRVLAAVVGHDPDGIGQPPPGSRLLEDV